METLTINENSIQEDYTIHFEEPLGTGVNGEVYACTDVYLKRYAVKILPDCEEARKEASIQWDCRGCDQVVKIFDVYSNYAGEENKPLLYIVMELVNSGELWEYLYNKRVDEEEARKLMKQIILAVDHLHSSNIAHRDLKPENILVKTRYGKKILKLADFGFAEIDDQKLFEPLYTFYYAAPEVLVNDSSFNAKVEKEGASYYDKKCDLWSLGVIAYVMLMGYPPFSHESIKPEMNTFMYESIISGSFFYEELDWDKYSDDAHDFVFGLLQLNPEHRPSAKELLQHPWISPEDSYEKLFW